MAYSLFLEAVGTGYHPLYRNRINQLPPKYQAAILAVKLPHLWFQDREADYELMLSGHLHRHFQAM